MWNWLKRFVAPPVIEGDEEKQRIAHILNNILLVELGLVLGLIPTLILAGSALISAVPVTMLLVLVIVMRVVLQTGRVRVSSILFLTSLWLLNVGIFFVTGGLDHLAATSFFAITIATGLLLGVRPSIVVSVLNVLVVITVIVMSQMGIEVPNLLATFLFDPAMLLFNLILSSVFFYLTLRSLMEVLNRSRQYAADVQMQSQRLQGLFDERTRELTRRTAYLGATTALAREGTSEERDLSKLLARIIELVSDQFGFYHSGIFLNDPTGEWAELAAASSEGGHRMLERGHRLRIGAWSAGQGIVGYVADRGLYRIALDVGADATFFANPDLPLTRSELAVPLRNRGQVIGVLDVQSTESEAFTDEDVSVLQAIADQVSMTISNARLLQEIELRAEAERRAFGEAAHGAWQALLKARPDLGFLGDARGLYPVGDLWEPQMKEAARTGHLVSGAGAGESHIVAIPIQVRDQVVGVIDGRKPEGQAWTPEEIELAQALLAQLGTALEGSQLYEASQRRAAREQVVREITDRMRAALDWDGLMHVAVQGMADTLDASHAFVQWLAVEGNRSQDPSGQDIA